MGLSGQRLACIVCGIHCGICDDRSGEKNRPVWTSNSMYRVGHYGIRCAYAADLKARENMLPVS